MPDDQMYRVGSSALNLRSEPRVDPSTVITVLQQSQLVTVVGSADVDGWVIVSTEVDGAVITGYVSGEHLVAVSAHEESSTRVIVPEAHLQRNHPRSRREQSVARMYPLSSDHPLPTRRLTGTSAEKAADLTAVLDWLDVENSPRYAPIGNTTFCNIYAHDYCYLAGVYLPRVWWLERALFRMVADGSVPAKYNDTVRELNANNLFEWLIEWGPEFGWHRVSDLNALQRAANDGGVGIVVGQRKDLSMPGHIVAVVPETESNVARRSGGNVTAPLQSEAGRTNRKHTTEVWWTHDRYRGFAFWVAP